MFARLSDCLLVDVHLRSEWLAVGNSCDLVCIHVQ